MQHLIILDTETCGFAGGILEIGFSVFNSLTELTEISAEDFKNRSVRSRHKNPMPIAAEAFAVHGISEADVKDCPLYEEEEHFYNPLAQLLNFQGPATELKEHSGIVIVGHNVRSFDSKVANLSMEHMYLDTMVICRQLVSKKIMTHEGGCKLDILSSIYCSKEQAHMKEFHGTISDNWKVVLLLKVLLEHFLPNADLVKLIQLSDTTLSTASRAKILTTCLAD